MPITDSGIDTNEISHKVKFIGEMVADTEEINSDPKDLITMMSRDQIEN